MKRTLITIMFPLIILCVSCEKPLVRLTDNQKIRGKWRLQERILEIKDDDNNVTHTSSDLFNFEDSTYIQTGDHLPNTITNNGIDLSWVDTWWFYKNGEYSWRFEMNDNFLTEEDEEFIQNGKWEIIGDDNQTLFISSILDKTGNSVEDEEYEILELKSNSFIISEVLETNIPNERLFYTYKLIRE
jgi:hypothetical protein